MHKICKTLLLTCSFPKKITEHLCVYLFLPVQVTAPSTESNIVNSFYGKFFEKSFKIQFGLAFCFL